MTDKTERLIVVILAAISLVSAFGMRFSFWADEAATYEIVKSGWGGLWQWFVAGDPHPPLYFALLKIWAAIFGYSEVALRLPSVLLFPAIVYLTWLLAGRSGLDKRGRLLAAAFVALHPLMMLHARMARYFFVTVLLFLCDTLSLFCAIEKGKWRWLIYAFCLALLLWTDFPAYLVIPVHLGLLLWKARDKLWKWAIAAGISVITAIPAVVLLVRSGISYGEDVSGNAGGFLTRFGYLVWCFILGETGYPWQLPTTLALIAIAFFCIRGIIKRPAFALVTVIIPLVIGTLVFELVTEEVPFWNLPARLLFLTPMAAIMFASGAKDLRKGVFTVLCVLGLAGYLWGAAGVLSGKNYHNLSYVVPWREIAAVCDESGAETAISRDWAALYYIRGKMRGINARDIDIKGFPDGKIAVVTRPGESRNEKNEMEILQKLIRERGAPEKITGFVSEDLRTRYVKELILNRYLPEYYISVIIISDKGVE